MYVVLVFVDGFIYAGKEYFSVSECIESMMNP